MLDLALAGCCGRKAKAIRRSSDVTDPLRTSLLSATCSYDEHTMQGAVSAVAVAMPEEQPMYRCAQPVCHLGELFRL